ncbi:MAG: type II secretion system F family protein [Planctomycetota bacterium]
MNDPNVMLAGAFAATVGLGVASAAYGAIRLVSAGQEDARVRQRLRRDLSTVRAGRMAGLTEKFGDNFRKLTKKLTHYFAGEGDERGDKLKAKLIRAGIYQADAPRLFLAARVGLGLLGVGFGLLMSMAGMFDLTTGLGAGGLIGYMAPAMWLKLRVKKNQKELSKGLPDGLDLMVVCVEAGLTIDAAMQRVGDELGLAHPTISREFAICHMETRIGVARQQALRNLGVRTDYPPLQALAAMLIQAERFGTSIAKALRIQADSLRVKRQQDAEEQAAKASVKLTFPLVLFIFPASFLVMGGPVVLKMMKTGFF